MRRTDERPEGFPSRLQYLVELAGGIQRCSDLGGISRRTMGNWLREHGDPTPAAVERFAEKLGIDATWLRRGEGVAPTRLTAKAAEGITLTPLRDPGVRSIVVMDPTWVHWRLGTNAESLLLVNAPDDSMAPLIERGDPVLGRKMRPGDPPPGGNSMTVYFVEIDGEVLLRFAAPNGKKGVFRAENSAYPVLEPKKFQILGKALWTGRSLEPLVSARKGSRPGEAP